MSSLKFPGYPRKEIHSHPNGNCYMTVGIPGQFSAGAKKRTLADLSPTPLYSSPAVCQSSNSRPTDPGISNQQQCTLQALTGRCWKARGPREQFVTCWWDHMLCLERKP
ncbi:hypothetical protein SKAU_G00293330 [Synaphobranchus kaupii]|uniref:Uncharacterized protein n=1 Tax=Synaphobranchus kaupii TaxID=118154 RepID=A0A9Q1EU91_SYNKA|nr:hypothetical protein SKAU_G00293330 [Synaphobranchus kaupii]